MKNKLFKDRFKKDAYKSWLLARFCNIDEFMYDHYAENKEIETLGKAIINKYKEFGFKAKDTIFVLVKKNGDIPILPFTVHNKAIRPYTTIMKLEKNGLIEIKDIDMGDFIQDDHGEALDVLEIILEIKATKKLFNRFPKLKYKEEKILKSFFKLSKGINWEDIEIKLKNEYDVEIRAKDKFLGIFNNEKLGFYKKKTKDKKPDKQWEFLQKLSVCFIPKSLVEPTIEEMTRSLKTSKDNCMKIKEKLSNKLQEIFEIDDDPFYDYKNKGYYQTKFILKPESLLRGSGEVWKQSSGFNEEYQKKKEYLDDIS